MKKTKNKDRKVIAANKSLDRVLERAMNKMRHERIQELLRGKGFIERFKLLIK